MTPRLVGLAGPIGVGKSAAASLIVADGGWKLISFADPLRELALALHPVWSLVDLVGPEKERKRPPSPLPHEMVLEILAAHTRELLRGDFRDHYPVAWADIVNAILFHHLSPRGLLRKLGDFFRYIDPMAFVLHAENRALLAMRDRVSVVIDDVRFESEAQMIRTLGGRIVHLQRRGVEYRRDHNSEQGITIAEGDLVLSNPGDMAGLRGELVQVLMPSRSASASASVGA